MTLFIHSALVALFPNQAKEFVRNQQRFTTKSFSDALFYKCCWNNFLFDNFVI